MTELGVSNAWSIAIWICTTGLLGRWVPVAAVIHTLVPDISTLEAVAHAVPFFIVAAKASAIRHSRLAMSTPLRPHRLASLRSWYPVRVLETALPDFRDVMDNNARNMWRGEVARQWLRYQWRKPMLLMFGMPRVLPQCLAESVRAHAPLQLSMNDIVMPRSYQSLIFFYKAPPAVAGPAPGGLPGGAAGTAENLSQCQTVDALCTALESVLAHYWVLCGEGVAEPGGGGVHIEFTDAKGPLLIEAEATEGCSALEDLQAAGFPQLGMPDGLAPAPASALDPGAPLYVLQLTHLRGGAAISSALHHWAGTPGRTPR